jgi:hypothetical protein
MASRLLDPPEPIKKLLWLKCPDCGKRIWNFHGAEHILYLGHWFEKHNNGKSYYEDLASDVGSREYRGPSPCSKPEQGPVYPGQRG